MSPLPPSASPIAGTALAPGLAFARLLSSAALSPADSVQWTYRDLRDASTAEQEWNDLLREVLVPADWTSEAARAFLLSRIGANAVWLPDAPSLDLLRLLQQSVARLRERGLANGYFVLPEDAALFAEEITSLLLRQMAAFGPAATSNERSDAATHEDRPRSITLETPGLTEILAAINGPTADATQLDFTLSPEVVAAADQTERGREHLARRLRPIAESLRSMGELSVNLGEAHPFVPLQPVPTAERAGGWQPSATLNLTRFLAPDGRFDLALFCHAARLLTTALEIEYSAFDDSMQDALPPADRPLALGLANLGALLMESGIAYDSPHGRSLAAALAAVLSGEALAQSARIAETCPSPRHLRRASAWQAESGSYAGACDAFRNSRAASLDVVRRWRAAAFRISADPEEREPAPVADHLRSGIAAPGKADEASRNGRSAAPAMPETARHGVSRAPDGLAQQLPALVAAARSAWDRALMGAELFGLRNLQALALQHDATAAAILDCDSEGLAPQSSLTRPERRTSTGETAAPRVRRAVITALFRLGYTQEDSREILSGLEQSGTLASAARLRPEHRGIFALPPEAPIATARRLPRMRPGHPPPSLSGVRRNGLPAEQRAVLDPAAVLRMFAAVRPFLSEATPLTLELHDQMSTVEVTRLLLEGTRLGVGRLRFHSPGLRATRSQRLVRETRMPQRERDFRPADRSQNRVPPRTAPSSHPNSDHLPTLLHRDEMQVARVPTESLENTLHPHVDWPTPANAQRAPAERHPLPPERASVTHTFSIAGNEGNITVGLYPNGQPGEVLLRMPSAGAIVGGLLEALSTATSLALQHGVPLPVLAASLSAMQFEPSGTTTNPQIPYARSLVDYLFRWLELRFTASTKSSHEN